MSDPTLIPPASAPFSYDEVPYSCGAFEQSHPNRLATLATLFGMSPPDIRTCRVLELGCGNASNLLPMALGLPEASFLGIDLSSTHIEEGRKLIAHFGVRNIELRHMNLLDLELDRGQYDYIIAHGIFSWVPHEVQEKMFALCAALLSPQGVGYISYNTYPGWHLRAVLRDLMRFHTRDTTEPYLRAKEARAAANFVAKSVPAHNPIYANLLKADLSRVLAMNDAYLIHDDLADLNQPIYFRDFIARASRHGLRYLTDAMYAETQDQTFPDDIRETLRQVDDLVTFEQYLDFLNGKAFRHTLLCRQNVKLDRQLTPQHAQRFYVTSYLRPISKTPDLQTREPERFRSPNLTTLTLNSPLSKAAMLHLFETTPRPLRFDELLVAARARAQATSEDDALELSELLMEFYGAGFIEFHIHRPEPFTDFDQLVQGALAAQRKATDG